MQRTLRLCAGPALFGVAGVLGLLAATGVAGFGAGVLAILFVLVGIWMLPSAKTLSRSQRRS